MMVVEELEHARARGAHIYAEVIGYGSSNDAYHMAAQIENGAGAQRAMEMALRKARIRPEQIDYINAHGTGTPINDRVETLAIKQVLGEHAYRVAISSTKSMTGPHDGRGGRGGGDGLCLRHPGELHAAARSTWTSRTRRWTWTICRTQLARCAVDVALSNSIGLGGHNSCLILRRVEHRR